MRSPFLSAGPRLVVAALGLSLLAAVESPAIEMFTYFGDGSRIGLPSLEVPIEAYPGIPLRSERLRARRRAMRMGPGVTVPMGPAGTGKGITVRAMQPLNEPAPPVRMPAPPRAELPPVAPEPEQMPPALGS